MNPQEILDILLKKRNITNRDLFLNPPHPLTFSLIALGFEKELEQLKHILNTCKKANKKIVVYTDYDADGITGGSVLWETLHLLGFSVFPYVPHRQSEGYGFSVKGIDAVIEKYKPGLIISVDHGISARDQIQYAADKGIPIIVTDHHTKPKLLPERALAIIHCPLVSGSGLAYIVALDLWRAFDPQNETLKCRFTHDFLALASLGTVADLVPLTGYSRSIARFGLAAFTHAATPGIRELLAVSGLIGTDITSYHAGFALAPRINAIGRLSHALDAVRLFCTKNEVKAKRLAMDAQRHNSTRQQMVEVAVNEALSQLETSDIPHLIVLKNSKWNEGIIGLISSKITERFRRPSIIMTISENGWKGSARSVKGFDIVAFLRSLNMLKHVGGHPQAAGFSLTNEELSLFESQVINRMSDVPAPTEKEMHVDMEIPIHSVTFQLAEMLKQLMPFGIGNPTPTFQSDIQVNFVSAMGKTKKHLKFVTREGVECIYFSPSEEQKKRITPHASLSILYSVETSYWQGKKQLKCFVKAVKSVL